MDRQDFQFEVLILQVVRRGQRPVQGEGFFQPFVFPPVGIQVFGIPQCRTRDSDLTTEFCTENEVQTSHDCGRYRENSASIASNFTLQFRLTFNLIEPLQASLVDLQHEPSQVQKIFSVVERSCEPGGHGRDF